MTDTAISAALLTPPEGIEDWNKPPAGLVGAQPVAAIDRGGCFRYCFPQVLVSAETAAAQEYLRAALRSDEDRINYDVSADRVVAERGVGGGIWSSP